MSLIIGLSGKKQHGKSTVAKYLRRFEFHEISWAGPLKEIIGKDLFGFNHEQLEGSLKETIDPFWGISPRTALQLVGTECFRKQIDDNFWVKLGVRKIELLKDFNTSLVIPDCRFPNEAEAIKKLGGYMVRVVRSDAAPTDSHASEIGLDDYKFDAVLEAKSGDIEGLQKQTYDLVMELRKK